MGLLKLLLKQRCVIGEEIRSTNKVKLEQSLVHNIIVGEYCLNNQKHLLFSISIVVANSKLEFIRLKQLYLIE